jgi:hypothetical protein
VRARNRVVAHGLAELGCVAGKPMRRRFGHAGDDALDLQETDTVDLLG